ncbi:hypothetical protein ACLD9W_04880 [Neisseria sp. WLZKY-1]|uniref:hypothetical protein n=1 Tax=Neisseria sp. WLZKY-1 TaxID=3390377 RepID=UPI00397DEB38
MTYSIAAVFLIKADRIPAQRNQYIEGRLKLSDGLFVCTDVLRAVDNQPCGGVFGKNPRLPRQKCSQDVHLAVLFSLQTRIFPQKTASQAEYQ